MKRLNLFCFISLFFSSFNFAQDFWQQTNGLPYAPGNILSIAADAKANVYVGVAGSGMYRSSDSGKSFTYVSSILSNTSIRSIIIDQHGHIFAGDAGSKGVFRSTDDGTTWTQVLTSKKIHDMTLDLSEVIYAGTYAYGADTSEQGIFRSTDDGNNWEQIDISSSVALIQSLSLGPDGSVFVGGWIDRHNNWPRNLHSTNKGKHGLVFLYL